MFLTERRASLLAGTRGFCLMPRVARNSGDAEGLAGGAAGGPCRLTWCPTPAGLVFVPGGLSPTAQGFSHALCEGDQLVFARLWAV